MAKLLSNVAQQTLVSESTEYQKAVQVVNSLKKQVCNISTF